MEIKLNYTPKELSIVLDGLNNSIIALGKIYHAGQLGCEVPLEFIPLFENKSFEEIDNLIELRLKALNQLYKHLLTYEKFVEDNNEL